MSDAYGSACDDEIATYEKLRLLALEIIPVAGRPAYGNSCDYFEVVERHLVGHPRWREFADLRREYRERSRIVDALEKK